MPRPVPAYRREPPGDLDARALAFDRVRRVSNWVIAGAVAGAVVIAGAVAHQLPGHSGAAPASGTAPSGAPGTASGSGSQGAAGTGGSSAYNPSANAPTPTQQPPAAVSGGTGW